MITHVGQRDGIRAIAFVDTARQLDYVIPGNGGDSGAVAMTRAEHLFRARAKHLVK